MTDLLRTLYKALDTAGRGEDAHVFPTVLVEMPDASLKREPGWTMADIGSAYLKKQGLRSDRTKRGPGGYPGLFRLLNSPPAGSENIGYEVRGPNSELLQEDRRPLYLQAHEQPRRVIERYAEHLKERDKILARFGLPSVSSSERHRVAAIEAQKWILTLARFFGIEDFENLFEAVFDHYDYQPAVGAPDLFAWNPAVKGSWFFAEVKGPNDHLRDSQVQWLRSNWRRIKGRFVLLILSRGG